MRIACPSCAVTYEVPESRLSPGKMVRCMRCGGEWVPGQEDEAASARPEPAAAPNAYDSDELDARAPSLTAMDRLAAASAPPSSGIGLLGAWLLTFVVLAGAMAATFAWREPIVRAWPPLARILPQSTHTMPQATRTAGARAE